MLKVCITAFVILFTSTFSLLFQQPVKTQEDVSLFLVSPENALIAEPADATDGLEGTEEVDEDEQMLIELRRRALEAEMAMEEGIEITSSNGLPISIEELDAMSVLPGNIGKLPQQPEYPADNLPTKARIDLGHKLYFDKRLSRDHSMSCATCHDPEKGWSDGLPRAVGFENEELGRHSPTVINTAYNDVQFWDRRASTLEQQAVGPIFAAGEMNSISEEYVVEMLKAAPEYKGAFEAAYGSEASIENIGKAIAAFERTVITEPSRFDQYVDGDKGILSDSEKRGLILFMTTASCTACHKGPNFTDNQCYSLGVRQEGPLKFDEGRFAITGDPKDMAAFKTPGLRNVEQSAPYMHDGSLQTLEEVVEFYNKGGEKGEHRSKLIYPLNLSESQKADLVAFLRSLNGDLPAIKAPKGKHFGT